MSQTYSPAVKKIDELFRTKKFAIPDYQRPYSWEDKHIIQLIDDFHSAWLKNKNSDEDIEPYFLGTEVFIKSENDTRFNILDGQQRMTTLMILFAVLRDFFKDYLKKYNLRKIEDYISDRTSPGNPYRLFTGTKEHGTFETFILKDIDLDADNRYSIAAEIIKEELESIFEFDKRNSKKIKTELNEFLEYIGNNIVIVTIECPNLLSAVRIFQTLNTRGKDLTVSDKTKSFLISRTSTDDDRKTVVSTWEDITEKVNNNYSMLDNILRSYRWYRREDRPQISVYEELKEEFENDLKEKSVINIVEDIYQFAKKYMKVEKDDSVDIYFLNNLNGERYWKSIVVTAYKEVYSNSKDLISELIPFFYSYWVAGHTVQKIKTITGNIISKVKEGDHFENIKRMIEEKRARDNIDDKVESALKDDVNEEKWLKYLIVLVECNIPKSKIIKKKIKLGKEFHIEHILPKTNPLEKKYWNKHFEKGEELKLKNTIGNLVPLTRELNTSIKRSSFPKKRKIYKKGEFEITKKVAQDYIDWTPDNIKDFGIWLKEEIEELLNIEDIETMKETISESKIKKGVKKWTEEELRSFLRNRTVKQKALLKAALKTDKLNKRGIRVRMNEILQEAGKKPVDSRGFTGVKSGITRKTGDKEYILPSQFDIPNYWTNEPERYKINPKYKDIVESEAKNWF